MPNRTLTTKRKIMEKKHRAERKQKAKEERGKYLPKFRFMAMSKLIGVIAFSFVFGITVYSMIEMHNTGDYSNLGQLIISAYGFASVYAGFYLLMAKVEHVEEEKTKREHQLHYLKKKGNITDEELAKKQEEIQALNQKLNDIISETSSSLL